MDRKTRIVSLQGARAEEAESDDFSAGEVLADGVRIWLVQLPAYAALALLVHAPLLFLLLLPPLPGWLLLAVFGIVEIVVALLVKAALVKAVLDAHRGLSSDFSELLEMLNKKAPAVLAVGLFILVRAAAKMLKLVLPGFVYLSDTVAAVPEVIEEGASPAKAVRRSEQLTRGARLPIFAICAVSWTLAVALMFASGLHKGGSLTGLTWMIVYLCSRSLDTSLAAVLSATAYRHLCQRPEA
jgi:hypothetical protein